jgi:hypothetical protein
MDELILDGNAVAGLFAEALGVEVTTASGTCAGCGAVEMLGAVRVYKAAGYVLRCPHCEAVLAKVVTDGTRAWIDFRGLSALQTTLEAEA